MSNENNITDSWGSWARRVLGDIEKLQAAQEHTQEQLVDIRVEIATLKAKAGMWGAIGGVVFSAIVSILVNLLIKVL